MLSAQSPSLTDGWQARTTELPRNSTSPTGSFSPLESASASSPKQSDTEKGETRLGSPQTASASLNWIPAGQIPASPWDRSKAITPADTKPQKARPSSLPHPGPSLPDRTIRQPISSASTSRPISAPASTKVVHLIEQPKGRGHAWETVPERGQPVEFNSQRPIVDLGLPIPSDSTVNVTNSETDSMRADPPLEAQLEQRSGTTDGTRRAARPAEPNSTEVGQANSMDASIDYMSVSPSNVVGVVAVPGTMNRYAEEPFDRPMNTFVPSHEPTSRVIQASVPESEANSSRMRLASQVSRELLRDNPQSLGMAPLPVEPPSGWKNVEKELREHLTECDELLRRNAILSAREEVLMGLRILFRALDLRSGDWTSEPAFDQALAAFMEEADFHRSLRNPSHAQSTARIVSGHATQALKQVDLDGVSPELAAQHYRAYARQQLVKAAQGHPWAADLFYAFGKTFERRSESATEDGYMFQNQAIACYTAALDVSPNHTDGANQLGFTLMKLDRMDEAYAILNQATVTHPSADAWRNLAELYRRRGQLDQALVADQQATAFGATNSVNKVPEVLQVDPQTFVALSPNQFMSSGPGSAVQSPPVVAPAAPPTKSASWFSRLVR